MRIPAKTTGSSANCFAIPISCWRCLPSSSTSGRRLGPVATSSSTCRITRASRKKSPVISSPVPWQRLVSEDLCPRT